MSAFVEAAFSASTVLVGTEPDLTSDWTVLSWVSRPFRADLTESLFA